MSKLNDLLMPKLGLTMTEGLLVEWSVASGDRMKAGDPLFVVETDKVANEILADADGVLGEILVQAGETVPVGAVVARWTGSGQDHSQDHGQGQGGGQGQGVGGGGATADSAVTESAPAMSTPAGAAPPRPVPGARIVATPLARRLARQHGLELADVSGSGPQGRIKASDVRSAGQAHSGAPSSDACSDAVIAELSSTGGAPSPSTLSRGVSGLAQAMAKRMTEAKQVPHFYLSAEAEVSELLTLRRQMNADDGMPKLTLNHFVIAAVARALEALPQQNRIWQDGQVLELQDIDVGMAVATDRGLMAPVLHDLAGNSLDDIALRASDLIEKVRAGKATREDMDGGAITISNAGMFNVTYMTPIINPPQSAILGVGSIREVFRPDANGAPMLKREMGLVLAADHRVHDGVGGLRFLNYVIDLLQAPHRLLRGRPRFKG